MFAASSSLYKSTKFAINMVDLNLLLKLFFMKTEQDNQTLTWSVIFD